MTRTELMIHDISAALSGLPATTPNRVAIFERTLESLVRFAISEDKVGQYSQMQADIEHVNQIRIVSKDSPPDKAFIDSVF